MNNVLFVVAWRIRADRFFGGLLGNLQRQCETSESERTSTALSNARARALMKIDAQTNQQQAAKEHSYLTPK